MEIDDIKVLCESFVAASHRQERQNIAVRLLATTWECPSADPSEDDFHAPRACRSVMVRAMDAHLVGIHHIENLLAKYPPPICPVRMGRLYALLQAAYDEYREMHIDLDHK
ncbi:MAG: hypothetical protein JWM57_2686, partial [Phycisphaerales bacterium]|nr:hypothetical protein [Phycisphaerales bacterium]